MVSMDIGGSGGLLDDAIGVGVGIASVMTGGVPAMLRCIDPTALGLVLFDFNPEAIKMTRKAATKTTGNSRGGASNRVPIKVNPPQINVTKVIFVGDDVKMRVDTLFSWCAPPHGLFTSIAGLLGATVPTTQPDVTFQWGPPMLGFMYTVQIQSVDANYTRFHSSGMPIRAEIGLQMTVKPSLLGSIPTNPTSGGLPGRSTHLLREGESLQSIANHHYGRPGLWRKIAEINGITDPGRVRPGTTVFLPGPGELSA
jgi:nucleoid-associated protein YgaU